MKYDSTVNLGGLIQAALLALAVAGGYTTSQVQISNNATDIEYLRASDQRLAGDLKELRHEVQAMNKGINSLNVSANQILQTMDRRQ